MKKMLFLKKQYDDLFSLIQQRKNDYEELMREFEFRKFKSPAGWIACFKLLSYRSLFKSSTLFNLSQ